MRFSAYVTFISLWSVFVYAPLAHWVWGGGWLAQMGALDFAGGTVVHINAAVAALVAAVVVGKRQGYPSSSLLPHNVPLTLLGAGLLWFGWFGFNAGSALGATPIAALAFVTTMLARCRLRHGDCRGPGGDYAGRRIRQSGGRARHWRRRRGSELLRSDSPRAHIAG
jgi:ammonia channel protein AmtB